MPTAVFPGSFDPITYGHIRAVERAADSYDRVVVALGINADKKYMFNLAEREMLARDGTKHLPNVEVMSFEGMLIHFLREQKIEVVLRGMRNMRDHEDNLVQDLYARSQENGKKLRVYYDQTPPSEQFISSSILKAVIGEQGDAIGMAPLSTIQAVQGRARGQYLYGITGMSGAGKSYICGEFIEIAERKGIPLHHVDVDLITHDILSTRPEPWYVEIRKDIGERFGAEVVNPDGSINRKKLGSIVFADPAKLRALNEIVYPALITRLSSTLRPLKGIVLVDYALLAEGQMTPLVNNHLLLIAADEKAITHRLFDRADLNPEQVARRAASQLTTRTKEDRIRQAIEAADFGSLQKLTNNSRLTPAKIEAAFDRMVAHIDRFGDLRKQAEQTLAARQASPPQPATA